MQNAHSCHRLRRDEVLLEVHRALLEPEQTLAICLRIFTLEPLNYAANNHYAQVLVELDKRDEALAHIRTQLTHYPGNAMLQRLLIAWLTPGDLAGLCRAYQDFCASHPSNTWARRGLTETLTQLQRFPEAVAEARVAVAIDQREAVNYGYLGDALLADDQADAARDAFREAIRRSCDYDYAYARLLATRHDTEAKRTELEFIYNELMQQVSYGQGILGFQALAPRYFPAERVASFLQHAARVRADLWHSHAALAMHYRDHHQFSEAMATLEQALVQFPLLPRLHLEFAETLRLQHRTGEAIEALKQCLALSPRWIRASNSLCELYEAEGRLEEALALQQLAVRHSPLSATPQGYIADLLLRLERPDEAREALEAAIARDVNYTWAWGRLHELAPDQAAKDALLARLAEVLNRFPENARLLTTFADLSTDTAAKRERLEAFLVRHPHDIDVCTALLHLHVANNDFARARALSEASYWGGEVPIAIAANEAWIYRRENNPKAAIRAMEALTQRDPNYYDAWRYLAIWAVELREKTMVERAVANCARLYPHDPSVLCFCAEKLDAVKGDASTLLQYLQHAFELAPDDSYIALTYIDELLERRDLTTAQAALKRLLRLRQSPYIATRAVSLAVSEGNQQAALDHFRSGLCHDDGATEVVYRMWRQLQGAGWGKQAAAVIEELRTTGAALDPHAGRALGDYDLARLGARRFARTLRPNSPQSPFEARYLEAYLHYLSDHKKRLPRALQAWLPERIKEDSRNWGIYCFSLYRAPHCEAEAVRVAEGLDQRADAEAWALYFVSLALRDTGNWRKGAAVIDSALARRADRYHDDLLTWHYYDQLNTGQPVQAEQLSHLHLAELEPLSRYVLAAAKVLVALNQGDVLTHFASVSPLLRDCQHCLQPLAGNAIASTVKTRLRRAVTQSLPRIGGWRWLYYRWQISNHF